MIVAGGNLDERFFLDLPHESDKSGLLVFHDAVAVHVGELSVDIALFVVGCVYFFVRGQVEVEREADLNNGNVLCKVRRGEYF